MCSDPISGLYIGRLHVSTSSRTGLMSVPLIPVHLEPQNVFLFRNRTFADVTS